MRARGLIAAILALTLALPSQAIAASIEIVVSSAEGHQRTPDISGRYVVWEDERWGYDDLWMHDLGTGTQRQLSSASDKQSSPAIDGTTVVAEDRRNGLNFNLFRFDLGMGSETPIDMTGLYDRYEPVVSGNRFAWIDARADLDVYLGALNGVTEPMRLSLDNGGFAQTDPAISGSWVVWRDQWNPAGANGDIWGYKFSTGNRQAVCTNAAIQDNPAVSGEWVVWEDYRRSEYDIFAKNMSALQNPSEAETTVTIAAGSQNNPDIDYPWVVWQDSRNGNFDIYAFNLQTKETTAVTTAEGDQTLPAISGNWVVWQDSRTGTSDIRAASLAPSAQLTVDNATGTSSAGAGGAVAVTARVRNAGNGTAPASTAGIYLSTDFKIDRTDRKIGTLSVPALAAGVGTNVNGSATIPADQTAGVYRLGVIADDPGDVIETSENDNAVTGNSITVALPANDSFASAQQIVGTSGTLTGVLTYGATREAGEPKHAGAAGGASIWFKWIAPSNGKTTIDLADSGFDTTLGVYRGGAVNALTLVGSNDDAGARLQSALTFSAVKGTTYYVAVDGYGGAEGSARISWTHRAELTVASVLSVRRGTYTTVKGYLKPRHAARSRVVILYFERRESGVWKVKSALKVPVSNYSSYSSYSVRAYMRYPGAWRVRARHSDADHALTYSAYRTFTVR